MKSFMYGIELVQDTTLKRVDRDMFDVIQFSNEDQEYITNALLNLDKVLRIRNWKLKKIEVGF